MGQTVNLLAYAFGGSNPSLPTGEKQKCCANGGRNAKKAINNATLPLQICGIVVQTRAEGKLPLIMPSTA